MSRRSDLRVSEDDEKNSRRLRDPLLFPKNSSHDSLSTFMDDGDSTQDIESRMRSDGNSPEQGVPYFYQGRSTFKKECVFMICIHRWQSRFVPKNT